MVQPSSIPNEYYLGNLPGTLQYSKEINDIIAAELPNDNEERGYRLCEHSLENLQRVTPTTQRNVNWQILLMMKSEIEDGEIWLKAALLNKDTGKVALLTASNNSENITRRGHRAIRTLDGTWAVGHYRMSAPICFWRELKNRLLY
jgi:hypothetical protein